MAIRRSRWMDADLHAFRDLARTFCAREAKPNLDRYNTTKIMKETTSRAL
jgi:acyl-CoA dehydrogenase